MISRNLATITFDDTDVQLTPITADITLDEGWSPFVQVRATCPIESTSALLDLDPRDEQRVTIRLEQQYGRIDRIRDLSRRYAGSPLRALSLLFAGEKVSEISRGLYWDWTTPGAPYAAPRIEHLRLGLRSRRIDHVAGTVELTFASDEALLQDNAHLATVPLSVPAGTVYEAVNYVLARIGAHLSVSSGPGVFAPFDPTKNPWEPGVSAWEWVSRVVQAVDLRLSCDEGGSWQLTKEQVEPAGPDLALTADTIKRATDAISRDGDWYTAVVITYRWSDDENEQHTAYDLARLPVSIAGTNQRAHTLTYQKPYPGPGAAARILRSLLGHARKISVSAVIDYGARPGRQVTIALPSTPTQAGTVSAVTWHYPADDMDVQFRAVVDAGGIETEYTPVPEEEP
jgi:hypothetical protein